VIIELSKMEFEVLKLLCGTLIVKWGFELMMLIIQEKDLRPILELIPHPWRRKKEHDNEDYVR